MNDRTPAIDALRGLAAITVVIYHSREINWVGVSHLWHKYGLAADLNVLLGYASAPFSFGFLAVPLFFVISGYCIHRPNAKKLAADPDCRLNLGAYYRRRLWRVYPVLLAALLLTAVLDYYTRACTPADYRLGDNSLRSFLLNLFSLQNIFCPPYGTNGPLWTLGMELHFYLLYPVLFSSTKKFGAAKTVGAVFCISLITLSWLRSTSSQVSIFAAYWFTWAAGLLVAEFEAGRCAHRIPKSLKLGILFVVLGCGICSINERLLAEPILAAGFAIIVWWSLDPKLGGLWEMRWGRVAAGLGIFSYSLYAIHLPFLVFLRSTIQDGTKSEFIAFPLGFTFLSIFAAGLLFWMVERYSLKLPGKQKTQVSS